MPQLGPFVPDWLQSAGNMAPLPGTRPDTSLIGEPLTIPTSAWRRAMRNAVRPRFWWWVALLLPVLPLSAQQKPTLVPADYGKWENLGMTVLSPDGKWLAWMINRTDGSNELRVRNLNSNEAPKVIAYGSGARFSNDSRWVAYSIGVSEAEREKLTKAKKPVQNKAGVLNLATGETISFDAISSFAFSDDARYIALRGYVPEGRKSKGADVFVRDLNTGALSTFGNVAAFSWRDKGTLLALALDAETRTANGVQVYDPAGNALRTLESGDATFNSLRWRKDDDDLAFLRTSTSDVYADTSHIVIAWRDLAGKQPRRFALDHPADRNFPRDMRVVDARPLTWSKDGTSVFFGIKARDLKPAKTPAIAANADSARMKASGDGAADNGTSDEPAGVEVWHAMDVDIMPEQKVRANANRNRNFLTAWHLDTDRVVQLGDDLTEDVNLVEGEKFAVGTDQTPYERDRMFGPIYRDHYGIDVRTGEKKKLHEKVEFQFGTSPGGRYALYMQNDHFFAKDLRTGTQIDLTRNVPTSFIDVDDDHTVKQKPPHGFAGWTAKDRSVLLYDKYDIWELPLDGSKAVRLTNGATDKIRHRIVRLDPEQDYIDLSRPQYVSLYGEWTKKFGYARLQAGKFDQLVWLDKNVGRLMKADSAEVYAYVVQGFDDSPDVFVAGPDLRNAKQVTETNPFQKDYAWGKSELINYRNAQGVELQASLAYPANYEPGRKYPMLVYFYEITSNSHHNYMVPSERNYYSQQVWSQNGYFVLRPDIVYRDRNPGLSAVDALVPAVDAAIATGMIDEKKVGLIGHSWGGYQTAFVPTQTNKFAAAVAGAPLTDLISMYLSIYWNTGGTDARIFEISQGRMEVPPWEDMESYTKNSPLFNIKTLNTPMLMTFGDKDGAVDWHQGIEYYNAARREGKQMVMLVYEGENHSLAKKQNQIDYHRRINQWFDHYLKGAPAASWITEGVSFLDREKELKQLKKDAGGSANR